ncbi:MAG: cytochrome c-type biogenesis protein CcmH [Anaerolineae bacterium]|nr:cytochrome c-type biogenesis protein CcmH [Anaerolineae bacterium]
MGEGPGIGSEGGRTLRPWIALLALLALALVGGFSAGGAAAQGSDFELPPGVTLDDVNAIARKMYCDVCEGIPLDECESIACRQWRQEIARQLGEGRTQDEIIDYFVERYGADVASLPRNKTDRAIAFGVPIVIVALIAIVGGVQVRNLRRRGQRAGQVVRRSGERLQGRPVPDDLDPALLERLQRELEGLDP